jgi:AbrB family looped-hinge helix DNA binding protein
VSLAKRVPGRDRGLFPVPEDFDAPLPEDILEQISMSPTVSLAITRIRPALLAVKRIGDRWHYGMMMCSTLNMNTVTLSPKFQVVIPREIREALKLEPGQKIQALLYENRVELIPVKPMKEMRGFLAGIDTTVPREKDRI